MMAPAPSGMDAAEPGVQLKRVLVHKKKRPGSAQQAAGQEPNTDGVQRDADIDRRIAELIPNIAGLSVSEATQAGAQAGAAEIRQRVQR